MKKSILRIIAASALCLAIATSGCASKPQESATPSPSPSAEASASQTAAPTKAPESQGTAPAEETSTQQATFFTSPLDKEAVVGDVVFPYSSNWAMNDFGNKLEFTSSGELQDSIMIEAYPVPEDAYADKDNEQIISALKDLADATAADAGATVDISEQVSIANYPGLLFAFSSPEDETRIILVLASDGKTMYNLGAEVPMGYAGSSQVAEEAENMIRDMISKAKPYDEESEYGWGGTEYGIGESSVDSSLPGDIVVGPSMSSMMEELNDENSIDFMGVLLRIPDGWQTIGKADDKFAMILPDNPDVKISISGGTPDELGIYGTPQDWLDAEYDDVSNNAKDLALTIKQTGYCAAGDVYDTIWASQEDDGLSLNAEALIAGSDGTFYRFSMTYPIATGSAGSSDSLTERVNEAIESFNEVLFLATPV